MGTHTIQTASMPTTTRTGSNNGRMLLTVLGGAALVVSSFLNWTRDMTGVTLSNHALVKTDFLSQTDVVRTVGGIAVVLGLVGMFGLIERTAWLTRLCGVLGIALFVMFTIEVYRSSVHMMQPGAWLALGGGVALLLAGFLRSSEKVGRTTVIEERRIDPMDPRARDADTETIAETESERHSEPA